MIPKMVYRNSRLFLSQKTRGGLQKWFSGIQDSFYHKRRELDSKNTLWEFRILFITRDESWIPKMFFFRNSGFFLSQEMRSWFQKWFIGIQDSFYHKKRGVGYKNGFQEFRILSIIKDEIKESWIPKKKHFWNPALAGFQKYSLGIQDSFYHKRRELDSKNVFF